MNKNKPNPPKTNKLVNAYTVKKSRPNVILGPNVHNMNNMHNNSSDSSKIIKNENKSKMNNEDVNTCFKQIESKYSSNLDKYWKNRTNVPYKNILYDQDYNKKFNNEQDLILCNVKTIDKIHDEQVENYKNNLEKHNNELKIIYSTNKQAEHFKQFEYNNKHKYRLANLPSSNQDEIKTVTTEYYNKEKKKTDNERRKKEQLLKNILI